jgi:dynein heavy chain
MGHPGGGRSSITQRITRHFNVVNFVPMGSDSLAMVFGTIMDWFLHERASEIKQTGGAIVAAATDLFLKFQELLRPTPLKSHYTFNLRDIASVFLGIVHMGRNGLLPNKLGVPEAKTALIKLWGHESTRVFSDRLTDTQDKAVFTALLEQMSQKHLNVNWRDLVEGDALIYGAFDGPLEVEAHLTCESLRELMDSKVEEYNGMAGVDPMDLVLFEDALFHLARVSRVINLPHGNALLVGVGGSGRKSLCKLAAFASGLDVVQLEVSKAYGVNEWHEDVKGVLRKAGKGEPTIFLFSDTQILSESFVEDVNNILNSGQVPNLFAPDEVAEILNNMKQANEQKGAKTPKKKRVVWSDFVDVCQVMMR